MHQANIESVEHASCSDRIQSQPNVDTGDRVWRYWTRFIYAVFVMIFTVKVVTILLVAISMSLSLAHALELPGKRRLDRATYLTVQTIYYPGFTIGGIAEPLSVVATLVLFFLVRNYSPTAWLVIVSFVLLAMMHLIFWVVVQPVNKFWLHNQKLTATGKRFFRTEGASRNERAQSENVENWVALRNRWEYSHFVRAGLSLVALVLLTAAVISNG